MKKPLVATGSVAVKHLSCANCCCGKDLRPEVFRTVRLANETHRPASVRATSNRFRCTTSTRGSRRTCRPSHDIGWARDQGLHRLEPRDPTCTML